VVWTTNAAGEVVADLPAWRELTGQAEEEIKGWGWMEALHPDDREEAEKIWKSAVEAGSHYATEFRVRRRDGVYRHLMVRGVPIFEEDGGIREWMGICSDITQDKELREKLIKSEKLASVGRLAGAVGHDLRNPLGVISNAVFYLNMKLKDADDKVREHLKILKGEVEKGNKIIEDLLDFSRAKPPSLEKSNINAVVQEALDTSLAPDNIMVEKESGPGLPEILIDRDRIRRAFLNLITNAFQAMPGGGKLTITARAREGFVEIEFQDAGAGIPEKHIQDIFEPLFTLKARGTGLGLSIVKNIIEEHKGTIGVESEEGQGATFTVKLPVQ
jgi:PAS domain S-box-containing protein